MSRPGYQRGKEKQRRGLNKRQTARKRCSNASACLHKGVKVEAGEQITNQEVRMNRDGGV